MYFQRVTSDVRHRRRGKKWGSGRRFAMMTVFRDSSAPAIGARRLRGTDCPLENRLHRLLMRRFWLVFAQTATICLAALFVVSTLRPDLIAWRTRGDVVTVKEPAP